MKIPKEIKQAMKQYGMNKAELVGDNLYALSSVAEDGSVVPTGLPVILDFHMGVVRELPTDEAFKILRNL